jgi:hypothetical protein
MSIEELPDNFRTIDIIVFLSDQARAVGHIAAGKSMSATFYRVQDDFTPVFLVDACAHHDPAIVGRVVRCQALLLTCQMQGLTLST